MRWRGLFRRKKVKVVNSQATTYVIKGDLLGNREWLERVHQLTQQEAARKPKGC